MPKKKNTPKNPRYLRRRRASPLKIAFWLVLALLAGFVAYMMYRFIFDRSFDLPMTPSNSSEESSKESSKDAKKSSKDSKETSSTDSAESESLASSSEESSKTPTQNDGEDPNVSASLTGSLTSANVSGNSLVLRVNIDQYLSSGTCSLVLTHENSIVKKSAAILPTAATSSCEGFDIPLSELGSGTWEIKISLSSGDRVGEITGKVDL